MEAAEVLAEAETEMGVDVQVGDFAGGRAPRRYADSPVPRWLHWISEDSTKIVAITCGESHTVLLSEENKVFTFGDGSRGQLGHGSRRSFAKPKRVDSLTGLRVAQVVAGGQHTLLRLESGLVYSTGRGDHGQLGLGDTEDQLSFKRVEHAEWFGGVTMSQSDLEEAEERERAALLGPYWRATVLPPLNPRDAHYPFAQPTDQQLGLRPTSNTYDYAALEREKLEQQQMEKKRELLSSQQGFLQESMYYGMQPGSMPYNTSGVARANDSFTGGGTGLKAGLPVRAGAKAVSLSAGAYHSVVCMDTGAVFVFGNNDRGQLGLDHFESQFSPVRVTALHKDKVTSVSASPAGHHTLFLTALGVAWACGAGDAGQLGSNDIKDLEGIRSIQPGRRTAAEEKEALEREQQRKYLGLEKSQEEKRREGHPLNSVNMEAVYAGGTHSIIVESGGRRAWVCGAGGFGRPQEQNVTRISNLLKQKLDEREGKKVMVIQSTVRMISPHEKRFEDLVNQLALYGPFSEPVCAHLLRATLDRCVDTGASVEIYAHLIERVTKLCLGIAMYSFRKLIVSAFEDACLKALQKQDDAIDRKALERSSQRLSGGGGAGGTDTVVAKGNMFAWVQDRESYKQYVGFQAELKVLASFLRELYAVHHVLEEADLDDLLAGCPGSHTSIKIKDSHEAERKARLLRGLVHRAVPNRQKELEKLNSKISGVENAMKITDESEREEAVAKCVRDTQRMAVEAAQAQARAAKGGSRRTTAPVGPVPPMYTRANEEAAWDLSAEMGWEKFRVPEDRRPEEGPDFVDYLLAH